MEKRGSVKRHQRFIDFANIFKAFIGTNYLSLSYGFRQAGLGFALIMLLVVSGLTNHCCKLIVKCKHILVEDLCSKYEDQATETAEESDVAQLRNRLEKNLDYADIGKLSVGRWGSILVNFFVVLTQIGFCVGYMVFVGNMLHNFFPVEIGTNGTIVNGTENEWSSEDMAVERVMNKRMLEKNNQSFKETQLTFSQENRPREDWTQLSLINTTETKSIENIEDRGIFENFFNLLFSTDDSVSALETDSSDNKTQKTSGSSLLVLVALPLPLFVIFTMFRNVRQLGIVSVLANTSIIIGFVSVLTYIIVDFQLSEDYHWFVFSTLPVYVSQVIGAYEAIGTIIPIEASMESNRHNFNRSINIVVTGFTALIAILSTLGYLHYGDKTEQIIAQNLPPDNAVVILINITLTFGVICTYPLMIYPVVDIFENMIFAQGKCCGPPVYTHVDLGTEDEPLLEEENTESLTPALNLHVASYVPDSVPAWKRNLLRLAVAVFVSGLALLLRNVFAYVGAIVGAIGSCPLAFILPCLFHIKLNRHRMSTLVVIKDIAIIAFGTVCGAIGFVITLIEIIERL